MGVDGCGWKWSLTVKTLSIVSIDVEWEEAIGNEVDDVGLGSIGVW